MYVYYKARRRVTNVHVIMYVTIYVYIYVCVHMYICVYMRKTFNVPSHRYNFL